MIKLKNLFKKFGKVEICNDTNYSFGEKGLTCFFGPSGSGKSTIFNLIAGFDRSYEGEIEVKHQSLQNLTIEELCLYRFNHIGFIFQNYNLFKGYTSFENVLMGINLNSKITEGEKTKRALDLLHSLGLQGQINQKVETLSGGQMQRVSIARALINEPELILADEPTGALDEDSTKGIMEILKEISKTKKVIMISHDENVLEYADEIVELEEGKIISKKENQFNEEEEKEESGNKSEPRLNKKTTRFMALRNFKIHFFKFLLSALIISFGASAFVSSLSIKNITEKVMNDFKSKNFYYNIATVPLDKDSKGEEINKKIKAMDEVENVYYQYDLENIKIKNGNKTLQIPVKVPTIISEETMAYGEMPKTSKKEIAISSNVGNRISEDIKSLIGKEITLEYQDKDGKYKEIALKVSGLTNSKYQDFILSDDIEREIYEKGKVDKKNPTSLSFRIKDFEKIPEVEEKIKSEKVGVFTKSEEVLSFLKSFNSLTKLYTLLSYLILTVGLVISGVILYRVAKERGREISTLGALGYTKKNISKIIFKEGVYFTALSTLMSFMFMFILNMIYKSQFGYGIQGNIQNIIILIVMNLSLTMGLYKIINSKLVKTEIAEGLRK